MQTSKYTKYIIIVMVILFVIISAISCSTHTHTYSSGPKKVPPGQAKKMSGSKSAKAYAPGQQKKR
ncbi:hypothetical protein [Flavobacterium sp. FlaQc-28]|uniref:hypothetical protein n=1 Tax=Flavobacterium sp. FlaQc-28 TaxID=3374178 RepID=UPI0037580B03